MDMNDKIKEYLADRKNAGKNLKLTEITDIDKLSTDKCQVIYMAIGLNIQSTQYGEILGSFIYKPTNEVYQFRFHVHRPKQQHASLSNQMTNIEQVIFKEIPIPDTKNPEKTFLDFKIAYTDFGKMAFWKATPTSTLTGTHYDLRTLMTNIQAYSQKKKYCYVLRKTDAKRLAYLDSTANTKS